MRDRGIARANPFNVECSALIHPATDELGVPWTVLDLLLDSAARWPSRVDCAEVLDGRLRQLMQGQPMLTLRLARVLDEMTRKYGRLGYDPCVTAAPFSL